jgi:DNA-binding NarL/FixJ family response regulator
MHPDSLCERALRAGALGYINKENTTGRILDAIRSVRNGEIYLVKIDGVYC